jgi:hypothetical protein
MTPELFVLAGKPAAEIGAELNAFRRRIVRRVLTDGPLLGLAGPNGFVRYAGCGTALAEQLAPCSRATQVDRDAVDRLE